MDVYVATKTENYLVARLFMRALEEAGHDITHDWTEQVEQLGAEPEDLNIQRDCAEADIRGVTECDVFVLILYKGMVGSLIEFGMAIALDKAIYIIGDEGCPIVNSIFFSSANFPWHDPDLWSVGKVIKFVDEIQARTRTIGVVEYVMPEMPHGQT